MRIKNYGERSGESWGKKRSREYRIWDAMKSRCANPKQPCFKYYGGRGISVCDRWRESFLNFLEDMGRCPDGMELDRIDNSHGYSPENCRWITHAENMRNTDRAKKKARDTLLPSLPNPPALDTQTKADLL